MKLKFASAMGLLVVALTIFGCGHYLPSQGWVTLIDGDAGMENWNITGGGNWRAADGAIQADKSTTKGSQITVKLNGVVTVSAQDSRFPEGKIGLQFNGGPIKFRKLLVKEL
jgi:hypothetical protein